MKWSLTTNAKTHFKQLSNRESSCPCQPDFSYLWISDVLPSLSLFFVTLRSYFVWLLWRYRFVRDKCFLLLFRSNFFLSLSLNDPDVQTFTNKQICIYFISLKKNPERKKEDWKGKKLSFARRWETELILCWSINAIGILWNAKRYLSDNAPNAPFSLECATFNFHRKEKSKVNIANVIISFPRARCMWT